MSWWTDFRDDVRGVVTGRHPDDVKRMEKQQQAYQKQLREAESARAKAESERRQEQKRVNRKEIRARRNAYSKPGYYPETGYIDKLGD